VITSTVPIKIALQDETNSQWHVPRCSPLQPGYRALGSVLRISLPKGIRVKHSVGDDTWEDIVQFRHDPTQQLKVWEGPGNYNPQPLLFSAFVHEQWILGASDMSERTLVHRQEVLAVEVSGRDESGNRWRWIEHQAGVIYYRGVHQDAASFFDGAIDSICVEN
jgi:hypothetical protein